MTTFPCLRRKPRREDARRFSLLLCLVSSMALGVAGTNAAQGAQWWTNGVLTGMAVTNDYAPANAGQLKNLAWHAYQEMQTSLPGGAGAGVSNRVVELAPGGDFSPINIGQLKYVAEPFYERLMAAGYAVNYPWTETTNGLLLHYTFDMDEAGIVTDASGNGRTATVNGATWVPDGARGGAYRFGSNSQTITATDAGLPSGDAPRSIAAWMKLDTTCSDGGARILSYGTHSYNQLAALGFDWREGRNQYDFSQHGGVFLSDRQIGEPGTWVHVAYTYGGNGTHHFYIDGVPSDGMNELGEDPLETVLSGLLRLGGHPGSTGPDGSYLDDVRIYDCVLSAEEIAVLAVPGNGGDFSAANVGQLKNVFSFDPGLDTDVDGMPDWWESLNGLNPTSALNGVLAGWWKLDEGSGPIAVNSATNGYPGELMSFSGTTNSGWVPCGKLGGAVRFDGVDDWIRIAQNPLMLTGGAFTVSAWAWLDANCASDYPEAVSDARLLPTGHYVGYCLGFSSSSEFGMVDDTLLADSVPRVNQWIWIALEFDGTNMRVYRNGHLVRAGANATFTSATNSCFAFGDGQDPGFSEHWKGMIDDVRIYRAALGTNEMAAHASGDLDDDGLSNLEEYQDGTKPNSVDTDGDGIPDGWEVQYGLDPLDVTDGGQDADHDGVLNAEEFANGSDPNDMASIPAGTRYVDSGASGGGQGTYAEPYSTIQAALDAVPTHGWIVLKEGVYQGAGNRNLNFGGKPLTLRGLGGAAATVIDCTNAARGMVFDDGEGLDTVVEDVTLKNGRASSGNGGAMLMVSSGPTIRRCVIESGIAVNGLGGAIHSISGSPVVASCILRGNVALQGGAAISLVDAGGASILNNSIVANTSTNAAILLGGASAGDIVNNTVMDNAAGTNGAIYVTGSSAVLVANNIISFNTAGLGKTSGSTLVASNNCVYGNIVANYFGMDDLTGTDGNISEDPEVVVLTYGDIRIQPTSKCRDAGNSLLAGAVALDLKGSLRIQGEAVDIGAVESTNLSVPEHARITRADGAADLPVPENPLVIRVKTDGDDANSGADWASAKRTIQAAIQVNPGASHDGLEVWIAAGMYIENVEISKEHVSLYGGFGGVNETAREQRDVVANPTIIDGSRAMKSVVQFEVAGLTSVLLDGLTLQHGTNYFYGGGVYSHVSGGIIRNCIVANNEARMEGGGLAFERDGLIENCTIRNNTALYAGGGGVLFRFGGSEINHCFIENNTTTAAGYGGEGGGGIRTYTGSCIIRNCLIRNNRATGVFGMGGAILCGTPDGRYTLVDQCTITSNQANYSLGGVGGCRVSNSIVFYNTGIGGQNDNMNLSASGASWPSCSKADYTCTTPLPPGTGNIADDPRLDADGRLTATSPCFNAGDPSALGVGLDLDGAPRKALGRIDIGAYEFSGTGDTDGDGMPDDWEILYGLNPLSGLCPSLSGWWKLDDGSGSTALNSAMYGYHGELMEFSGTETSGWVSGGKMGGAVRFDGVDDWIRVAQNTTVLTNGPFTLSAWVWLDATTAASCPTIISDAKVLLPDSHVGYSLGQTPSSVFAMVDGMSLSIPLDAPAQRVARMDGGEEDGLVDGGRTAALRNGTIGNMYAFARGGQTIVRWETGEFYGAAGFYLERQVGGEWMRISQELLPYPLFGEPPIVFEEVDPGAGVGDTCQYRIVELETGGNEQIHGPYEITVTKHPSYADWATFYFTPEERANPAIGGRLADPDGDWRTNWQEYLLESHPRQADALISPADWAWVVLEYDGAQMRLYRNGQLVGTSENTSFTCASNAFLAIGAGQNPDCSGPWKGLIDDVRAYRSALGATGVAAIYDAWGDPDGDGLTNLEEYQYGTSPNNPDLDGDGLLDGWEIANGFDPFGADVSDLDGDGLSNSQELQFGTDPQARDTDGDGLSDSEEVWSGMDPLANALGSHPVASLSYEYDDQDRLQQVTSGDKRIRLGYDKSSNLSTNRFEKGEE